MKKIIFLIPVFLLLAQNTFAQTPIGIASLSPANRSIDVNIRPQINVTFNGDFRINMASVTLYRQETANQDILVETFPLTPSGTTNASRTLRFTISNPLESGKKYFLKIPAGAVTDTQGNDFQGIDNAIDWTFTTFSTAIATGVELSQGKKAACLEDTIVIVGQFLTGVTSVQFGATPNMGIASGTDLILESDSRLKVKVPSSASAGSIILRKIARNPNPATETIFAANQEIGPSKATLSNTRSDAKTDSVCNIGSTLTAPMRIEIKGGKKNYTVKYVVKVVNKADEEFTESNYTSNGNIDINPRTTGTLHEITLVSVKDENGCKVPKTALSGSFSIYESARPTISSGVPKSVNSRKINVCLTSSQQNIILNNATLGSTPSVVGASGVEWRTLGDGDFANGTKTSILLQPNYRLANGDLVTGNVRFTITSTGNPKGCDAATDFINMAFSTDPTANAGGDENSIIYQCWDGQNQTVTVPLNGSISNATGYEWSSTEPGTFTGGTTIQNPTYRLHANEIAARRASITLVATNGTCGGNARSAPDIITIQLISPSSTIDIRNPKIEVCAGEKVTYQIFDPSVSSNFEWRTRSGLGRFNNGNNGRSVVVEWGNVNATVPDTLIITETDIRGCTGTPYEVNVRIHNSTNAGITSPSIFSFPRKSSPVLLTGAKPTGDTDPNNTMIFSGDGVISTTRQVAGRDIIEYYFNPSAFWDLNPNSLGVRKIATVGYEYQIGTAQCSGPKQTASFIVYDGSQAFTVQLGANQAGRQIPISSNDVYEICGNQPVKIAISPNFLNQNPLQNNHVFQRFTIDFPRNIQGINGPNSPFVNVPDPNNTNLNYVVLYPDRLRGLLAESTPGQPEEISFPIDIEINGWQNRIGDTNDTRGYGRIFIRINSLPELSPTNIAPSICSGDPPMSLTRNENRNPENNYNFFIEGPNSGLITGNAGNGFLFSAGALFPNATPYSAPSNLEIKYAYEDNKGCRDTTSFSVQIVQSPQKLAIANASVVNGKNVLCASDNIVPIARTENRASYTSIPTGMMQSVTTSATIEWYDKVNLINDNKIHEGSEYTPNISTNRSHRTFYYVVQEIEGCTSEVLQVEYEVLRAPSPSWNKSCVDGSQTEFTINLGNIQAANIAWQLKSDPNSLVNLTPQAGISQFNHEFLAASVDSIMVEVTGVSGCVSSSSEQVITLKSIAPRMENIYIESFNTTDGSFVAAAAQGTGIDPPISTWEHGTIAQSAPRPLDDSGSPVWATGLTGSYGNGERSYLYVGCVDLSNMNFPIMGFNSWVNTIESSDGAVLQYSVDDKIVGDPNKIWKAVGRVNSGLAWYNQQLIESIPNNAISNYGWSKADVNWRASRHSLEAVKADQLNNNIPVLRFAFAATRTATGKSLGGMAIDDFFISEQTRVVLVENFTNTGNEENKIAEQRQSEDIKMLAPNDIGTKLVKINYHVGFPASDPFNIDNPAGPSSRALYYGINSTPTALVDGRRPTEQQAEAEPLFSIWGRDTLTVRSLEPSEARISIDFDESASIEDNEINITVNVVPEIDIPQAAKLYVIIVEGLVNKNDLSLNMQQIIKTENNTFEYVCKTILPSPTGLDIEALERGESYTFGPLTWTPGSSKIYGNSSDISIIAFIQNEDTKNIYQVAIDKLQSTPSSVITGVEESKFIDHIKIYPNPADQNINIILPHQTQSDIHIRVTDPAAGLVHDSVMLRGKTTEEIDIKQLSPGVYILSIESNNGAPLYKKIIVTHND